MMGTAETQGAKGCRVYNRREADRWLMADAYDHERIVIPAGSDLLSFPSSLVLPPRESS